MAKLYVIAGEASGDSHGAAVLHALRARDPSLTFFGAGGPKMKELADPTFHDWLGEAAVLGLWEVIRKYGWFRAEFAKMLAEIEQLNPDAVLLIDYPGFNLRMAKALRARRPKLKILYYISPQVWAWNRGRIPKMAKMLDLMLCIFPFEKPLYERSGLKTVFVGHPMADHFLEEGKTVETEARESQLVALLPGSREREIRKIFPCMLEAAARMQAAEPTLRFESTSASERLLPLMQELAAAAPLTALRITLRDAHGLMRRAECGMVASGTATMEAAFLRLPFVLIYKVHWFTYAAARALVRVPFLCMANILANRGIVREFIQHDADPDAIANELLTLVRSPQRREQLVGELDTVVASLGGPGASERAADAILAVL